MSMSKIPREILLKIAYSISSESDRQSLRLVCRGFKALIDQAPPLPDRCQGKPQIFLVDVMKRRDFLPRLLREGNLFDGTELKACSGCLKFRPVSDFPLDVKFDDFDICGKCICDRIEGYTKHGRRRFRAPNNSTCSLRRGDCGGSFPLRDCIDCKDKEGHGMICGNCIVYELKRLSPKGHKFTYAGNSEYSCPRCLRVAESLDWLDEQSVYWPCAFVPGTLEKPWARFCETCHDSVCTDVDGCDLWTEVEKRDIRNDGGTYGSQKSWDGPVFSMINRWY